MRQASLRVIAGRLLASGILTLVLAIQGFAGTVTGAVQNPSGGAVGNGTFSFTLTQAAVISGTATLVNGPVNCYTDASGNVVNEPNPLVPPVLSQNIASGTLAAGVYFVRFSYADGTGQTFASPEGSFTLTSNGTLIMTAPVKQPANVTSYKVYIGTSSGAETLQGSVTVSPGSWGNYSQSSALVVGAALPGSNTTVCTLHFNDEMQPSFVCYDVGLSVNGATVLGYPQFWYLNGGSAGTVNVSIGTPVSTVCQGAGIVYPQAILSQPAGNGAQSINGPLNLNGFSMTSGPDSATSYNNIPETNVATGADPCAKHNTAMTAFPLTGNTAIGTGDLGLFTCNANSFSGVTTVGRLLLGNEKLALNGSANAWTVPYGFEVPGAGRGDNGGNNIGTTIQASGSWTASVPVVTLGTTNPFNQGTLLSDLTVDCNNLANTAFFSQNINEKAGLKRVVATNCKGTSLNIATSGGHQPQNFVIDETEIYPTTFGAGQVGAALTSSGASFGQFTNSTVVANVANKLAKCWTFDNFTSGVAGHLHCEQSTEGLVVGLGNQCAGGVFSDITGAGVTTNIAHVAASCTSVLLLSVSQLDGAATNTVKDDISGFSFNNFTIPFYLANTASTPGFANHFAINKVLYVTNAAGALVPAVQIFPATSTVLLGGTSGVAFQGTIFTNGHFFQDNTGVGVQVNDKFYVGTAQPASESAGDVAASRSATTGLLWCGSDSNAVCAWRSVDGTIQFIAGTGATQHFKFGAASIGGANYVDLQITNGNILLNGTSLTIGATGSTVSLEQRIQNQTTGAINATTRTEVLVSWPNTMTDTNYTVTCSVQDSATAAGTQGLTFERLRTKTATQVGLVINNPTAGAITGSIDCRGGHQ